MLDIRTKRDVRKLARYWAEFKSGKREDETIRAYKFVTDKFMSPFASIERWRRTYFFYDNTTERPLDYSIGNKVFAPSINLRSSDICGEGINIGSVSYISGILDRNSPYLDYALSLDFCADIKYVAVEFKLSDIGTLPYTHSYKYEYSNNEERNRIMYRNYKDKFRLYSCTVIEEVDKKGNPINTIENKVEDKVNA